MERVGIVGFGNMGEAIAGGLSGTHRSVEFRVFDPDKTRAAAARDRFDARTLDTPEDVFRGSDITVLAIKPQVLDSFFASFDSTASKRARCVSVIAGVPVTTYKTALQTDNVVRFMPNLAATVGKALVGICYDEPIESTTLEYAFSIADAMGERLVVPERLMSAVTGVSGSGIAYVFSLLHAMALGGTQAGLPYRDSLQAALTALEGAAALVRERKEHPIELLSKVASPGGTTIEGIAQLEASGFNAAVMRAVTAAATRAHELETGSG